MVRAVLDTNVLFASLLSRRGASFEIMRRLRGGEWRMVLSNHLLLEYEELLKLNAANLGIGHGEVDLFLNAICQAADLVDLPAAVPARLRDPDDEPLLRLALASGARIITTHNIRDVSAARVHGVVVLPPRDFLRILRSQTQ